MPCNACLHVNDECDCACGRAGAALCAFVRTRVSVRDACRPRVYHLVSSTPGSKVYFLDAAKQQRMAVGGNKLVQRTPWNHFGRKNVGFLFAVQHGATSVFDFDDDNLLLRIPFDDIDRAANLRSTTVAVPLAPSPAAAVLPAVAFVSPAPDPSEPISFCTVTADFVTYNPYSALGSNVSGTWPRGFPLPHYKMKVATRPCTTATAARQPFQRSRVAVWQLAANHDPDVDAIYRLTRPLPFTFAAKGPTVVLPAKVLAPYNSQSSMHTYQALWALLLPTTVPGRVSDIWRGYAAQRLFWDVGASLAFSPPKVEQIRNAHTYIADLQSELDLYLKAERLVEFLGSEWACEMVAARSIPACMEQLWIELYERDYIEIEDVLLVQVWLEELVHAGYRFPQYLSR